MADEQVPVSQPRSPGRSRSILLAIIAAFLVARVPFVLLEPGGQDEQCFSVPGYTVATEGIPRNPYMPSRDPQGVFYRADEMLFTLPPAFFYLQAPFFLALPDGYPTSRWPSVLAGIAAIWLTCELASRFFASEAAGLWAAGMYSVSRVFYFPATFARPDMVCTSLGLGAIVLLWDWHAAISGPSELTSPVRQKRFPARVLLAGALCGLGLLTHPFAIVYCMLLGGWVLLAAPNRGDRIRLAALLALCAALAFALWLPLIAIEPEIFRRQFFNNVLNRAGPGLTQRVLWPWPWLIAHAKFLWEHAGTLQSLLMAAGVAFCLLREIVRMRRGTTPSSERQHASRALLIVGVAIWLLAATQGGHSTKGYLSFTGSLMFTCVGAMLAELPLVAGLRRPKWVTVGLVCAMGLTMLPGSGARTWFTLVQNFSHPDYNGRLFAERLLDRTPADARYVLDQSYAFDFWLAGRQTTLIDMTDDPFDLLVLGRDGVRKESATSRNVRSIARIGRFDDPAACYAEIFESIAPQGDAAPLTTKAQKPESREATSSKSPAPAVAAPRR